MKRLLLTLVTSIICGIILVGCSSNQNAYYRSQVNRDLLSESWMSQVNVNPYKWTTRANKWFFTGEPEQVTQYAESAPLNQAMTNMMIRVTNFTKINIDGDFRVQIVGHQESNSVQILGPNVFVRQVAVETHHNTLFLHKIKDCNTDLRNVIVRIGVNNLSNLTVSGKAAIMGRDVYSNGMTIDSYSSGDILLAGDMAVSRINQHGSGALSIIGAQTPTLDINDAGSGAVNVSGRVGIRTISNTGSGCINVIGADSNKLTINASGNSCTTIAGFANLKKVTAAGNSQVYLYWVSNKDGGLYVTGCDNARIGLAGNVNNMNVDLSGRSRFDGKNLHACNVYARTRDSAHANITADQKMFAAAANNSSVYFYGSPNMVSRFISENATVIPVWTNSIPTPALPQQAYRSDFKGSGAYTTPYTDSRKSYK